MSPLQACPLPAKIRFAGWFFAIAMAGLLIPSPCPATIYVPPDARELEELATLIVKAEVLEVQGLLGTPGWRQATLRLEKVHKGKLPGADLIHLDFEHDPENLDWLERGDYVVVFAVVSPKRQDHYAFASPRYRHGRFNVPRVAVPYIETEPLRLLEEEFIASHAKGDATMKREAAEQLAIIGTGKGMDYLLRSLPRADDVLRGWTYYSLLTLGDTTVLADAIDYAEVESIERPVAEAQVMARRGVGRVVDPGVRSLLEETMIRPSNPGLRLGAIDSTRAIGASESVPCLIEALDDERQLIRHVAVMALVEIERKYDAGWAPLWEKFRHDEQTTVGLWKGWWLSEGGAPCPYGGDGLRVGSPGRDSAEQ